MKPNIRNMILLIKLKKKFKRSSPPRNIKSIRKSMKKRAVVILILHLRVALKALHSRLQETNVPARENLVKKDKFFNVVNRGFILVFTASWAFA